MSGVEGNLRRQGNGRFRLTITEATHASIGSSSSGSVQLATVVPTIHVNAVASCFTAETVALSASAGGALVTPPTLGFRAKVTSSGQAITSEAVRSVSKSRGTGPLTR